MRTPISKDKSKEATSKEATVDSSLKEDEGSSSDNILLETG